MIYEYLQSFIQNPHLVELPEKKKHKLGQNLQQSHVICNLQNFKTFHSLKSNLLQGYSTVFVKCCVLCIFLLIYQELRQFITVFLPELESTTIKNIAEYFSPLIS